jgi:hypothetical protein
MTSRTAPNAPSTYVTYLRIDELLDLQKPAAARL